MYINAVTGDSWNLDEFRTATNGVQSLADFIHDVSRETVVYANKLEKEDTPIS